MATGPGMDMVPAAPADPAWLFYTSGTTGRPKGATLTHRVLMAMTMAYFADIDHVTPGDTLIQAAPVSHGSGLFSLSHVGEGGVQRHSGERALRAGRDLLDRERAQGVELLRRARPC